MIFVDTNVFIYAVGKRHPNQIYARMFFWQCHRGNIPLFTSSEVLQELMHVFIGGRRVGEFDVAMRLMSTYGVGLWSLEPDDVEQARELHDQHPSLSARDLCYLASCRRRGIADVMTFDRSFRAAFYGEG